MTAHGHRRVARNQRPKRGVLRSADSSTSMGRFAPFLVALALAIAACTSSEPPPTPGTTQVRVALVPSSSTAPVHYASAAGIFAKHGLDVVITETQDLALAMQSLASGQFDLTQSLPTLTLIGAEKGMGFKIVSGLGGGRSNPERPWRPSNQWVSADPELDTYVELSGKVVGVPSLAGINLDSMKFLLGRNGIRADEVAFVQVPFAAMGDQLAAGRVDAVVAVPPFTTELQQRGFFLHDDVPAEAVKLASGGKVRGGVGGLFVASKRFIDDHPASITAWQESLAESMDYLNGHPDAAIAEIETWLKTPPDVAKRMALPHWNSAISADDLRPYVVICREVGTIKTDVSVDDLMWKK